MRWISSPSKRQSEIRLLSPPIDIQLKQPPFGGFRLSSPRAARAGPGLLRSHSRRFATPPNIYNSDCEGARRAVAEIEKLGRKSIALQADIASVSQIEEFMGGFRKSIWIWSRVGMPEKEGLDGNSY